MARRITQGKATINLDIDGVLSKFVGFRDDIIKELGSKGAKLIKKHAVKNGVEGFNDLTGLLRSRIKSKKGQVQERTYIAGAFAPHAHLVEYGHALVKNGVVYGHVPAHPFIRPAEQELLTCIDEVVRKVLKEQYFLM